MAKPLQIVFLNQPTPEQIFKAWAQVECDRLGARLTGLTVYPSGGKEGKLGDEEDCGSSQTVAVPA